MDVALEDTPRSEVPGSGVSVEQFEKARRELGKLLKNKKIPDSRKTNGWVIFEDSTAWSGDPGEYGPKQKDMDNKSDKVRKSFCMEKGIYGYVSSSGKKAWARTQATSSDNLINNIKKEDTTRVHVSPGASISLIKQRVKEGFKVIFEDSSDESAIKLASFRKKKSKRKLKKKSQKRKKTKRKSQRGERSKRSKRPKRPKRSKRSKRK